MHEHLLGSPGRRRVVLLRFVCSGARLRALLIPQPAPHTSSLVLMSCPLRSDLALLSYVRHNSHSEERRDSQQEHNYHTACEIFWAGRLHLQNSVIIAPTGAGQMNTKEPAAPVQLLSWFLKNRMCTHLCVLGGRHADARGGEGKYLDLFMLSTGRTV